jgi:hypothetical protein
MGGCRCRWISEAVAVGRNGAAGTPAGWLWSRSSTEYGRPPGLSLEGRLRVIDQAPLSLMGRMEAGCGSTDLPLIRGRSLVRSPSTTPKLPPAVLPQHGAGRACSPEPGRRLAHRGCFGGAASRGGAARAPAGLTKTAVEDVRGRLRSLAVRWTGSNCLPLLGSVVEVAQWNEPRELNGILIGSV